MNRFGRISGAHRHYRCRVSSLIIREITGGRARGTEGREAEGEEVQKLNDFNSGLALNSNKHRRALHRAGSVPERLYHAFR